MATGSGTKDDPWVLKTPPGTSELPDVARRGGRPADDRLPGRVDAAQVPRGEPIDDLHAMLKAHGDWMPLGGADEQKPAPEGSVEAWGRSESNPRRRLVRHEEGPARAVRRVHAAAARGARPGRVDPRRQEQPDARPLMAGGDDRAPRARATPSRRSGDPEPPGDRRAARVGRPIRPAARRRPADQPAGRLAPPAPPEGGRARRRGATRAPGGSTGSTTRGWRPSGPTWSGSGARRPSGSGSSPRTRRTDRGARPRATDRPLIEPIRLSFEVDCPPATTRSRRGPAGSTSGGRPTTRSPARTA